MVVLSLKLGPQDWSTIVEPHHPDWETKLTRFLVWLWWVIGLTMKWIWRLSRLHEVLVSILDSLVVFSLCPFLGNWEFFCRAFMIRCHVKWPCVLLLFGYWSFDWVLFCFQIIFLFWLSMYSSRGEIEKIKLKCALVCSCYEWLTRWFEAFLS